MKRLKIWLQGLSFRTGAVVIILSVICYVISFAQILLPIGTSAKWVIWFVFFGMAKTFQYSGLAILGVAGIQRLKRFWKKKKRI